MINERNVCEVCEHKIAKEDPAYKITSAKKGMDYPNVSFLICETCYVKLREWMYKNFQWKDQSQYKRLKRKGKI